MAEKTDVLIVGGGVIGLTLALKLQAAWRGKRRIVVLDQQSGPEPLAAPLASLRVSALSPASLAIMDDLGVWDDELNRCSQVYGDMRVWEAGGKPLGREAVHFSARDLGVRALGAIVENERLRNALWQQAGAMGVQCVPGQQVADLTLKTDVALIRTEQTEWQASLVVGADGVRSRIRDLGAYDLTQRDYQQMALVTHVSSERAHQQTAWQQFNPEGPMALLPLVDGRSSVVYSALHDHYRHAVALDDEALGRHLTERSGGVLGELSVSAARAGFALNATRASSSVRRRCVLIGDAAQRVHPLAGQGANIGLADAKALASTLLSEVKSDTDIGDEWLLKRYQRSRKLEVTAAMTALESLHRLFLAPGGFLKNLRNSGLALVNRSAAAKGFLARRAMGLE